jgi:hypothetical protein
MPSSISLQHHLLHFLPHCPPCPLFQCRPHRLLYLPSYSAHGRQPAVYPLGCMDAANRRPPRAILTESPPSLWGSRTRGLREALPHLTSTYILRDIARCRPLCSTLHVCKIKGSEYWTEPRSAARQTFVVLTERPRHAQHGGPLMRGLTRGLTSFPITSQSHPASPDCSCMVSLYMFTPSQSFWSCTPLSA